MEERRVYGTIDGVQITEEVIERLVKNAEDGFPGVTVRRVPGRPALGSAPATTVAVRLDPELHKALTERVSRENTNTSHVIREALRTYLEAS